MDASVWLHDTRAQSNRHEFDIGEKTLSGNHFIQRLVRRLGYELVPSWRMANLAMSAHLQSLFVEYQVGAVLDVGANFGQFRDFLRHEVGFNGPVHSFEPIPEAAARLRQRALTDPNWVIHEMALGSAPGTASFNVMKGSAFSSFLDPKGSAPQEFNGANVADRRISVSVETLDRVLSTLGLTRPYLKMDTQGFDLQVVAGGRMSIENVVALQTEAAVIPIYEGMPRFDEVMLSLQHQGFAVSGMFPVTTLRHRLIEFDCVMIRDEISGRSA